jgi:hypothetical protein
MFGADLGSVTGVDDTSPKNQSMGSCRIKTERAACVALWHCSSGRAIAPVFGYSGISPQFRPFATAMQT